MRRETFHHLDREWEATIPDAPRGGTPVRFRNADPHDDAMYESLIDQEELDDQDGAERDLALRRGLEAALVLDALAGHDAGLTAEEVARMTGMPTEAAADRLDVLDEVQPLLEASGPRRYRTLEE